MSQRCQLCNTEYRDDYIGRCGALTPQRNTISGATTTGRCPGVIAGNSRPPIPKSKMWPPSEKKAPKPEGDSVG